MTESDSSATGNRPTPPVPPPIPETRPPGAAAPQSLGNRQKSPPLAAVLSFILPGLGHLYAESYPRSARLFASFVLAIFLTTRWWPFVFLCVCLWFFGMFDSFREAQLFNLRADEGQPSQPSSRGGTLLFGAYLLIGGGMLLLDNFGIVDFDWFFHDWWPALVIAAGLYFLIAAFRERRSPT